MLLVFLPPDVYIFFCDCLSHYSLSVSSRGPDIKVDPRSGCLILPVIPDGRLQFYNPENDSVLTTVSFDHIANIGSVASQSKLSSPYQSEYKLFSCCDLL